MNKRRLSASKQITLGAMVTALTMLCLYAAAVLPSGRIGFFFLSSLMIYVLCCEEALAVAAASFGATAILALLVLPDKFTAFSYALLLGHYGIFKTVVDRRVRGRLLRGLIKLLYCNVLVGTGLYLAMLTLAFNAAAYLPAWLPVWGIALGAQILFLFFDLLYGLCTRFYENHLRRVIVPRR